MTPEQQQRYERDRAEAQAVYDRLMMESNAVVIRARAPVVRPTPKPLLQRLWQALRRPPPAPRPESPTGQINKPATAGQGMEGGDHV